MVVSGDTACLWLRKIDSKSIYNKKKQITCSSKKQNVPEENYLLLEFDLL